MWRQGQRGGNYVALGLMLVACENVVVAQTDVPSVQPYASMDRGKVSYQGAGRESGKDIGGEAVRIGILLPLSGTRAPEGELLRKAAQVAIDEENRAGGLLDGRRFVLAVQDESGSWGQASSAMVHLVMQDEAVALITSTNGNTAHQAEQIANKVGIPVVTLSSDPTTTRINIPWIFRVGPSDAEQARAIAGGIYGEGGAHKIVLVTESGHDGRIGGEEFLKAVNSFHAAAPERLEIKAESFSATAAVQEINARKPEAVVLWAGPALASHLVLAVRRTMPSTAIYLCQKAAAFLSETISEDAPEPGPMFTVGSKARSGEFAKRYRKETGQEPGIAAQQTIEAVRAIAAAVRRVGVNRARVRDSLATNSTGHPQGEIVSFDPAGNVVREASLVGVEVPPDKGFLPTPD